MKTHSITAQSVLLAVMLCLAILGSILLSCGTAFAGALTDVDPSALFAGGSGTSDDPYLISNEVHLNNMRYNLVDGRDEYEGIELLMGNYKLTNDIVVTSSFLPLPNFNGRFFGNNKTITFHNLYTDEYNLSGLFSRILSGIVQDLTVNVLGESGLADYRGGICGKSLRGEINNCNVTGQFASLSYNKAEKYIGGICGYMDGGVIFDSTSSLNITTYGNAGGLVGYLETGTIIESTFSGQIRFLYENEGGGVSSFDSPQNQAIGGICGRAHYGQIRDCYVISSCAVSYIGASSNNKYLRPRVGFLVGINTSMTYDNIFLNVTAPNDPGTLQHKIVVGITIYNQKEFFKIQANAQGLVGKQI